MKQRKKALKGSSADLISKPRQEGGGADTAMLTSGRGSDGQVTGQVCWCAQA